MKYLNYKKIKNQKRAFVENVAIFDIAKQVGTPFYAYSKKSLLENFLEFKNAFADIDCKICYAIKANANLSLVKILAQHGSGIDAVSAGEIFRAIKAGIDAKKIVFAGVGKTKEEIKFALENGVEEFSVESEAEMFALNEVASNLNKKAKFSLRVNPNVDAKTHDKISTGRKGDKFGVDIELAQEIYQKASKLPALEIYGISTHIGSQITSIAPFKAAFEKIRELCLILKKDGNDIKSLDLGGGIGINYQGETLIDIIDYAKMIKEIITDLNVKLTIAPGRAMVGNCGILACEIIYIKKTEYKKFAIIDAAMNDLARPGLYDSFHETIKETISERGNKEIFDLAGPICESTDILAKSRKIIDAKSGDIILFLSAGAYGSSMSNEYNARPLIPEVLIDGDKFEIIRRRPSFDEMIALEV
jgi:diaminopimelate decarboxylase